MPRPFSLFCFDAHQFESELCQKQVIDTENEVTTVLRHRDDVLHVQRNTLRRVLLFEDYQEVWLTLTNINVVIVNVQLPSTSQRCQAVIDTNRGHKHYCLHPMYRNQHIKQVVTAGLVMIVYGTNGPGLPHCNLLLPQQ